MRAGCLKGFFSACLSRENGNGESERGGNRGGMSDRRLEEKAAQHACSIKAQQAN